jgi:hypothetical protein
MIANTPVGDDNLKVTLSKTFVVNGDGMVAPVQHFLLGRAP